MGLFEFADPATIGAGERAALVAEQLTFQERLRDRGAIDRQKRRVTAAAMLINRPRHEFFAGAAFAEHQHRHVLRGDAANRLVKFLHRRRTPHQLIRRRLDFGLFVIQCRHTADLAGVNCPVHDAGELVEIKRFEKILERSQLHRFDCGFRRAVGGDHDYRQPRIDLANLGVGFEPSHVGQAYIQDHGIRQAKTNRLDSLTTAASGGHRQGCRLKRSPKRIANVRLVVDYEYAGHGTPWGSDATGAGRRTAKIAPPSARLPAVISPPCDCTIRRQMAKPRPRPVSFVLT